MSENAICESIVALILNIVSKNNDLPVWSHIRFDVSAEEGLSGIPDFIIAPASDIGTTFKSPVICVSEAKKEDFNNGWAQTLAEMIAARRYNQDETIEIFGIVTTGAENLQKLLNIINWIFQTAKKTLDNLSK